MLLFFCSSYTFFFVMSLFVFVPLSITHSLSLSHPSSSIYVGMCYYCHDTFDIYSFFLLFFFFFFHDGGCWVSSIRSSPCCLSVPLSVSLSSPLSSSTEQGEGEGGSWNTRRMEREEDGPLGLPITPSHLPSSNPSCPPLLLPCPASPRVSPRRPPPISLPRPRGATRKGRSRARRPPGSARCKTAWRGAKRLCQ